LNLYFVHNAFIHSYTKMSKSKRVEVFLLVRYIWGVDSAQAVTDELYQCVVNNFSFPNYWGRYLSTVAGASDGLTQEEINFLKQKGVRILPIYNNFRRAVGYDFGAIAANNAIFHARRLGMEEGKVLIANVERFFEVDEAWIRGWVNTILPSGYRSGIYHDPTEGNFSAAYCEAIKNDPAVRNQVILLSAEPQKQPTGVKNAPRFNPVTPPCKANVWAWQYARDTEQCPIDTNLISSKLFNLL
jgi:hypothetical protein